MSAKAQSDPFLGKATAKAGEFTLWQLNFVPSQHVWSADGEYLYMAGGSEIRKIDASTRKVVSRTSLTAKGNIVDLALSKLGLIVVASNRETYVEHAKGDAGKYWTRVAESQGQTRSAYKLHDLYIFDIEDLTPAKAYVVDANGIAAHSGSSFVWTRGGEVEHVIDLRNGNRVTSLGRKQRLKLPVTDVAGEPPFTSDGFIRFGETDTAVLGADGRTAVGQVGLRDYRVVETQIDSSGIRCMAASRELHANSFAPLIGDATGHWVACPRGPHTGVDRFLKAHGYYIFEMSNVKEPVWAVPTEMPHDVVGIDAKSKRALAGLWYQSSQWVKELRLYEFGRLQPSAIAEVDFPVGEISIRPGGTDALIFTPERIRDQAWWVSLPKPPTKPDPTDPSQTIRFTSDLPDATAQPTVPADPLRFESASGQDGRGPSLARGVLPAGIHDTLFSPDGTRFYMLEGDGLLHAFDSSTLVEERRTTVTNTRRLEYSAAGLVSLGEGITLLDPETLAVRRQFSVMKNISWRPGFSRDSRHATIAFQDRIYLIDLSNGELLDEILNGEVAEIEGRPVEIGSDPGLAVIVLTPNGDQVLISREFMHEFDISKGKFKYLQRVKLPLTDAHRNPIRGEFGPDEALLVMSTGLAVEYPSFENIGFRGSETFFGVGAGRLVYLGHQHRGRSLSIWQPERDRPLRTIEYVTSADPDPIVFGRALVSYGDGVFRMQTFSLPKDP